MELKFRYWCPLDKKYQYDYREDFNSWLNGEGVIEQFTGQKDINGKEIYVGDIVYAESNDGTYEVKLGVYSCELDMDQEGTHVGFFIEMQGHCSAGETCDCCQVEGLCNESDIWLEIKGNVHNNEELLKKGNK